MNGSNFIEVNSEIIIGCISPEASELLDEIMAAWALHLHSLKESNPNYEPSHYAFAYWLVRWSNLIMPNNPHP